MKKQIIVQVFVALILGILAGIFTGPSMEVFGVPVIKFYDLIGRLFLNALTLIVIPLVISSIISGTARMASEQSFGKLGGKTFGYYFLTLSLGVIVGLLFAVLIAPGVSTIPLSQEHAQILQGDSFVAKVESQGTAFDQVTQIFLRLIPSNIFAAASEGQILGLITFSLLFGFFLSKIDPEASSVLVNFWKGVFQVTMKITYFVMKALPIGVFALMAKVIATTGLESLQSLAWFSLTVVIALFVHMFVVLPLLLKFIAKVNPIAHMRAMAPALFTAFSTSSSAASLPVIIDCVEKRAGVSNRICSFTVPMGITFNLSGSALYECIATIFIAQVYGVALTPITLFIIYFLSVLTSMGLAGVPSACMISTVIILRAIGLPPDGIGLALAVERIFDMLRTSVNVFSISCCSVLVARSEGEQDVLVTSTPNLLPTEE